MKIVADSNILFVDRVFNSYGELFLYKTRIDDRSVLINSDALLCRSTIKVNKELLDGTNIKFVATATSGTEHFDKKYLDDKKIKYVDAKGSNSNSVAEYVIAAILDISVKNNISLEGKKLGVVGWGCVGKKVEVKAKALGLDVMVNDPPLEDSGIEKNFSSLDEILTCDIISLHVPLIFEGKYKTLDLFDSNKFSNMRKGVIFINTSRGKVVKEPDFINAIESGIISHSAIDVWYNEPDINTNILKYIDIATPHIAGHSLDGKALGTDMIYKEFLSFYNMVSNTNIFEFLPEPEKKEINVIENKNIECALDYIVKQVYDINKDDKVFRQIEQKINKSKYFNYLRNNYYNRREFFNTSIKSTNKYIIEKAQLLGFKL